MIRAFVSRSSGGKRDFSCTYVTIVLSARNLTFPVHHWTVPNRAACPIKTHAIVWSFSGPVEQANHRSFTCFSPANSWTCTRKQWKIFTIENSPSTTRQSKSISSTLPVRFKRESRWHSTDARIVPGNMEFPAMRRLSIATSHAFILVYSKSNDWWQASFSLSLSLVRRLGVDSMSSFEEIRHIIEQIKTQRSNYAEIPIVVVGNKTDRTSVREVDEQQVQSMLNDLAPLHCRSTECTALDRASTIDIFLKLLSLVQLSAARQLSPILRRKVSERLKKKEFEEKPDKAINRSRSLIRRTSMKKKAAASNTGDKQSSEAPDCLVSWATSLLFHIDQTQVRARKTYVFSLFSPRGNKISWRYSKTLLYYTTKTITILRLNRNIIRACPWSHYVDHLIS